MTREEAYDICNYFVADNLKHINPKQAEALGMAASLLVQEPCEDAISREDAINALKNLDDLNGENVFVKNGLYPWNILKELPSVQPKQIECGDIISRQDALLCCIRGEYPFDSPQGEENARIESELRKLPAAVPKIKTGQWILTKEDNDIPFPAKWYKCSECGREICEPTPNFCDECGARIIGIINNMPEKTE